MVKVIGNVDHLIVVLHPGAILSLTMAVILIEDVPNPAFKNPLWGFIIIHKAILMRWVTPRKHYE